MVEDWKNGGFGIYIHWPFCQAKCPYCDFNSHVSSTVDFSAWKTAFLLELDRASKTIPNRVVNSVFFGGGTPSLMPPDLVEAILEKIQDCWTLANDLEVTLEANPTSVEAAKFSDFRHAGVNRVSVGLQSLNDDHLRKLGRLHTVSEGLVALDTAHKYFDRVSFDLIYARQHQSLNDWKAELEQALTLVDGHVSLYQLTVESGTAFGRLYDAGKLGGLPENDLAADMYFLTQSLCESAGLSGYEISNHSAPGQESRHNLIYWRYGDYLGIGPGAHGRVTYSGKKVATECFRSPQQWLSQVSQNGGTSGTTVVERQDQAMEYTMMALRLNEGVDLVRLKSLSRSLIKERNIIALEDSGHVFKKDNRLIASAKGRALLNTVLNELIV